MSRRTLRGSRVWLTLMSIFVLAFVAACGGGDTAGGGTEGSGAGDGGVSGEPTSAGNSAAAPGTSGTPTPKIDITPLVKQQPTGVPEVECQEGQRELVWMVRNDPVANPWEANVVRPAFQKANPEICLKILSVNQDDIAVKRTAMISSGQALHVWSPNWGGNGFASDRAQGLLEDLTPLIEQDKLDLSVFIPEVLEIYQVEGKTFGLPFLTTGSYVYYNQELLKKAGVKAPPTDWEDKTWTWERMVADAKKLTTDVGNRNKAVYGLQTAVLNLEGPPALFGQFIWPENAYETGYADSVKVTDPQSVKAYQEFHDTIYKDKVAPDPATAAALDAVGGAFASGKVAMAMSGGWGHWSWKGLIDDPNGFCWGVAPMPWGTPDAKMRTVIYTDPWAITAGLEGQEKEDAWTLVKFLVSEEQARQFSDVTGTPPTQTKLLADYYKQFSKCMEPAKMKEVFEGAFTHGRESSNHLIVSWDELNQIWGNNLSSFFANKNGKAADMLKKTEQQTNEALQQIKTDAEADIE